MTDYRRNFLVGGSFFFTVNLEERHLRLLTDHIDAMGFVQELNPSYGLIGWVKPFARPVIVEKPGLQPGFFALRYPSWAWKSGTGCSMLPGKPQQKADTEGR